MSKQLFILFLAIFLVVNVSAQSKEAKKIDEFEDYQCEDLLARLDNFSTEIFKDASAIGVAISL